MPRRRTHGTETAFPPWLTRVRAALFAALPALEDPWEHEGTTYVCQRLLDEDGPQVLFTEQWLDRQTYGIQKQWTLQLEAAPFVGPLDEALFQRQITFVLEAITRTRPLTKTQERLPEFRPQRYAKDPHMRRPLL